MKPILTDETYPLVVGVMDSNPGALNLIQRLCHRTHWVEIMQFCLANGIVGDRLYQMYADECKEDFFAFGDKLESAWQTSKSQSTGTVPSPSEWATPSSILARQVNPKD